MKRTMSSIDEEVRRLVSWGQVSAMHLLSIRLLIKRVVSETTWERLRARIRVHHGQEDAPSFLTTMNSILLLLGIAQDNLEEEKLGVEVEV